MDNEDESINTIKGMAILVALVGTVLGCVFYERDKAKHTAYVGDFQGQHVRYMEFPDRNEMEIKGKTGHYILTDSEGFHRLVDPLGTNDILESVAFKVGGSEVYYSRKNTSLKLKEREKIPLHNPNGRGFIYYEQAGIGRFSCCGGTGILGVATGGLVRFFKPASSEKLSDYGYTVNFNGKYATNYVYNKNVILQKGKDGLEANFFVTIVGKFIPSFWARIALRVLCSTSWSSKIIRKGIDIMRKKKRMVVNQSCANLSLSRPMGTLKRQFLLLDDSITIKDSLIFRKPVRKENIYFLESSNDNLLTSQPIMSRFLNLPAQIEYLEIVKYYQYSDGWLLKDSFANVIK